MVALIIGVVAASVLWVVAYSALVYTVSHPRRK